MAEMIGDYIPLPVCIANDADCAVFGETVAGAAKGYEYVVMLTLGTGVGGGIVLDGKIYEGKLLGGTELGHCVIVEDGEQCTCGRRGCLEVCARELVENSAKIKQLFRTCELRSLKKMRE